MIHGHWLAEYGLGGSYERVDVPPGEVAAFVARIRSGEFAGGRAGRFQIVENAEAGGARSGHPHQPGADVAQLAGDLRDFRQERAGGRLQIVAQPGQEGEPLGRRGGTR